MDASALTDVRDGDELIDMAQYARERDRVLGAENIFKNVIIPVLDLLLDRGIVGLKEEETNESPLRRCR